jgi:N-acetylmuramoyl-L-alanine amidase
MRRFLSTRKHLFIILIAMPVIVIGVVGVFSARNTIRPRGIVIHHSAISPGTEENITAEDIEFIHKSRGFRAFYWGRFYHIGYHYVILPDGTIQRGRPDHCLGAHAIGYNSYIGVCLIGNFSSKQNPTGMHGSEAPTEQQMQALVALCSNLQIEYGIPTERIIRHNDVNSNTECPGDRFSLDDLLRRISVRLSSQSLGVS